MNADFLINDRMILEMVSGAANLMCMLLAVWHSLTFEFLLYFSLYSSDFLLEGNEHSLVVEITLLSRWNSYLIAVKISVCKVNGLACA